MGRTREDRCIGMRLEALEYLACPNCGADLHRVEAGGAAQDVTAGALCCGAGCGSYPIEGGVPRLLPELRSEVREEQDHQSAARRSFGAQWNMFDYEGTTWGMSVEERVSVALYELDWNRRDLPGKVILDAGCGNGTLSRALADLGATVVALDLSESVFRAQAHCGAPGVHFVQGNLFYPPLKNGVFDAIYSCGVFHHTPDTRRCFDALVRVLKDDAESRYFTWLYAKRSPLFNATVEQIMKLTRRTPSSVLVPTCHVLSPGVELVSRLLTRLGVVEHAPRSLRDRAIVLHDLLSPPYVRYHSFSESAGWARRAGFRAVEQTAYAPNDAGRPGPDDVLSKYRTVCRPGFGLLCRGPHRREASVA